MAKVSSCFYLFKKDHFHLQYFYRQELNAGLAEKDDDPALEVPPDPNDPKPDPDCGCCEKPPKDGVAIMNSKKK
jgi:hypothetical protein